MIDPGPPVHGTDRSPKVPIPGQASLLFVDDDTYMRRLMAARLEHLGAQVEAVASGQAALTFLESHRPDLIISDAVMPELNGFDLCRRLKADPLLQSIPIVILTALTRDLRQRSIEAGADDYLSKLEHEVVFRMRARLALELGVRLAARGGEPGFGEKGSLLVVSGSKAVQAQFESHLLKEGVPVTGVPTLAAALEQLRTKVPGVMALDLALAPENLAEWILQLRGLQGCAALPILALAGKDEDVWLASLEPLIQDRLPKPLDGQESRHRVNLLLRIAALG